MRMIVVLNSTTWSWNPLWFGVEGYTWRLIQYRRLFLLRYYQIFLPNIVVQLFLDCNIQGMIYNGNLSPIVKYSGSLQAITCLWKRMSCIVSWYAHDSCSEFHYMIMEPPLVWGWGIHLAFDSIQETFLLRYYQIFLPNIVVQIFSLVIFKVWYIMGIDHLLLNISKNFEKTFTGNTIILYVAAK